MILDRIVRIISFVGYLTSSSYVSFELLAGGILPEAAIPAGFTVSIVAWPLVVSHLTLKMFKLV